MTKEKIKSISISFFDYYLPGVSDWAPAAATLIEKKIKPYKITNDEVILATNFNRSNEYQQISTTLQSQITQSDNQFQKNYINDQPDEVRQHACLHRVVSRVASTADRADRATARASLRPLRRSRPRFAPDSMERRMPLCFFM